MIFEWFRAAERDVRWELGQCGARGGGDELGGGDPRVLADRGDDGGGGHARVVLDVGRDLHAVAELEAERADVELLAQAAGDRLSGVEVGVDGHVEGDERRSCGDERRAGGRMARRPEVGIDAVESPWPSELRAGAPSCELAVEI